MTTDQSNTQRLYLDIECYRNYFLIMFMNEAGKTAGHQMFEGQPLDVAKLRPLVTSPEIEFVSFNGNDYDKPMLAYALTGATCAQLKGASDDIITSNLKPWDFVKRYKTDRGTDVFPNHIDLINVAPGDASLKLYMGRMHCVKMQELPIAHDAFIEPEERAVLMRYCRNDLLGTRALRGALTEQIKLRVAMRDQLLEQHNDPAGLFPVPDLRSRSDAQIAEAVLKSRVFSVTGAVPRKWPISYSEFNYTAPAHIKFSTEPLQAVLALLQAAPMKIDPETGHVDMPDEVSKLKVVIGDTTYKIGLGGLHSQESEVTHYADDETLLCDIDVVSYYPSMILNMGMYPDSMGPAFLKEYQAIKDERIEAKRAGEMVKSDGLKITLNGTFGKTSNQYSTLYAPTMMIATTLTGQLSILMLIEALEKRGIAVVSANTDGIVVKTHRDNTDKLRRIVGVWERITKLETEESEYLSLHMRDVNSYVAIAPNGKVKTKGAFSYGGLARNPSNEICVTALVKYLTEGVTIEDTVNECCDLTKFITVRRVNGGAEREGVWIGKAIRWYYSTTVKGPMSYLTSGNMVPRTEGARAVMDLPDEMPDDLDYDWYINETHELLMDVGVIKRPPKPKLPRRNSKAWKVLVEAGEIDPITNKLTDVFISHTQCVM